ncbi:hypothetical protein QVD99_000063 [Batrachochytrium dendrobatidis]|nr:hypothetical protein O5D80_000022 [Batrachochytrium dendrobatidis]KAK5664463.1 hypothetical protein QVD99_000063 [Batrachochytrium dendrobatidis]
MIAVGIIREGLILPGMGKVFTGWRGLYPSRVYTPLIRVDPKEGLRVGLRITWVGGRQAFRSSPEEGFQLEGLDIPHLRE